MTPQQETISAAIPISDQKGSIKTRRDYSAASVAHLAPHIQEYILEKAALCQPDDIYVCDGSDAGDSFAN